MASLARILASLNVTTALTCTLSGCAGSEPPQPSPPADPALKVIGTYETGAFNQGAAEISAYDPVTQRLFSVNGAALAVDVVDISDPTLPALLRQVDVGGRPNSLAVRDRVFAVAVDGEPRTEPGRVLFFDTAELDRVAEIQVGVVPDMLVFTPDGRHLLVANEGEPSTDYGVDPEGSVSVVDLQTDIAGIAQSAVKTASFNPEVQTLRADSIRISGPGASLAQDLEPENIAVSCDSRTAWVTLQENNAVAVLDIETASFTLIAGLGFKDHGLEQNALDPNDEDQLDRLRTVPVLGMYQPDAVAGWCAGGTTYIATANEGEARNFLEAALLIDPNASPSDYYTDQARAADLLAQQRIDADSEGYRAAAGPLARLRIATDMGDRDHDGDIDVLHSFGARSFSIWSADVEPIYDSGSEFEHRTSPQEFELPIFNFDHHVGPSFDARSDDKGPEPEGVVVAELFGRHFAFVGLERTGGVMVYDVSTPSQARFVTYVNNREYRVFYDDTHPEDFARAKDLGPEGLTVIAAADSPTGSPLLVVSNEVSGTTTLFEITPAPLVSR